MTSVRTILVPVDFSPGSVAAARHAHELATIFHSHVHLLHVTRAPDVPLCAVEPYWGELQSLTQAARMQAIDRLARFVVGERFDPFTTTGMVRTGCPEQVISEYADQIHADLIVMGTHGDHAQPVGKVVERVIGQVDCPVMAIPDKTSRGVHLRAIPAAREAAHEYVAC